MRSSITILMVFLAGCTTHKSTSDGFHEMLIENTLLRLAISERQAIDKEQLAITRDTRGVNDMLSIESVYANYSVAWNQMFTEIKNGTMPGTAEWNDARREEMILYALERRRELSLIETRDKK